MGHAARFLVLACVVFLHNVVSFPWALRRWTLSHSIATSHADRYSCQCYTKARFSPLASNQNSASEGGVATTEEDMIETAKRYISERNPTEAFETLMQAYAANPTTPGLRSLFATCLQLKIDVLLEESSAVGSDRSLDFWVEIAQERMGLASLFIDLEHYENAAMQLREIVSSLQNQNLADDTNGRATILFDKSSAMLYRTNAALCDWKNVDSESEALAKSILRHQQASSSQRRDVPPLHPFEALKWPCVSLEQASYVARQYGDRAMRVGTNVLKDQPMIPIQESLQSTEPSIPVITEPSDSELSLLEGKKLRVGYLSPDFTGQHPLAFLMQDVFRHHNRDKFDIFLYSLSADDGSPEVQNIRDGADHWVEISLHQQKTSLPPIANRIREDGLDIMIDLCGHSGTSRVLELLACRVAPIQMTYMGFPGSLGASEFIDYNICDATVVPYEQTQIRECYDEHLILMPHSYFVNSHASVIPKIPWDENISRSRYNLPADSFVMCCHSRPDKIDQSTFRSWCRVLARLNSNPSSPPGDPHAILWLLRSGKEMEENLLQIAFTEFGLPASFFRFSGVAPRNEHLQRLALADVFLDTPAYNAHTVGCDALFAGVPMVTLLRPPHTLGAPPLAGSPSSSWVSTDKWASRVGASLLQAVGLSELIAPDMNTYEEILYELATGSSLAQTVQGRLGTEKNLFSSPLFDTARWVKNLEYGLQKAAVRRQTGRAPTDICIRDLED